MAHNFVLPFILEYNKQMTQSYSDPIVMLISPGWIVVLWYHWLVSTITARQKKTIPLDNEKVIDKCPSPLPRQEGEPGGGHWPRKGVWGCAAVMTPFFQASRRSLAYQFTIIAPLLCPPFSNFRKNFNFQPCFGQKFQLSRRKFSKFTFPRPLIFQGKSAP